MSTTAIDQTKLSNFVGKAVGDVGAAITAALVVVGDKLGLYKAMAGAGPVTAAELARRTETTERYVREWLVNQAAGGYVIHDPTNGRYTLPPEQALALADESNPAFLLGAFQVVAAAMKAEPRIAESFRTGAGLDWCDQDAILFAGTERFFRSGYIGHLVSGWIPALDGVDAKLTAGAMVADVGCGHGASTMLLAKTYPQSRFVGFDCHVGLIEVARRRARDAGVADRVTFEVARVQDFPGTGYDLVACFDCLRDMADPGGAARHIRRALASNGTWLLVEPLAVDQRQDNPSPVGRVFHGASTLFCAPCSLAENGPALGARAGEARLRHVVVSEGGFTRFRRATLTPFDIVLEARP